MRSPRTAAGYAEHLGASNNAPVAICRQGKVCSTEVERGRLSPWAGGHPAVLMPVMSYNLLSAATGAQ
jgi:hypothetical protein